MKQRSVDGLSKSKDTKQAWQKDGASSRQRQSELELRAIQTGCGQ